MSPSMASKPSGISRVDLNMTAHLAVVVPRSHDCIARANIDDVIDIFTM